MESPYFFIIYLTDWLVWKPGNGRSIRIGADPMIGSQHYYKLSGNLISTLKEKGIVFLANVESVDLITQTLQDGKRMSFWGWLEIKKKNGIIILRGL
jgi:hypothetical protein